MRPFKLCRGELMQRKPKCIDIIKVLMLGGDLWEDILPGAPPLFL